MAAEIQNLTTDQLRKSIDRNREEIDALLHSETLPLDFIYARIRMLKSQNERFIERIKIIDNLK